MPHKVEIISKNRIFAKAIFKIDEVRLRHSLYNGQLSPELTRLCLDRGDAVAVLVYDKATNMLLLAEQFRYPTYEKGPGWLVELPAGIIDSGETPEAAATRELKEECGYEIQISDLTFISKFYLSPGGASERIFLYYAAVNGQTKYSVGGGLVSEGEDIKKILVKVDDIMRQLDSGEINDAKTIVALYWYRHHFLKGK